MIPKRRKPKPMGCNQPSQIRCPGHLQFVRSRECSLRSSRCAGKIEAAHVRTGTDGGLSVKPSDFWTIPLCAIHHRLQHDMGEPEFERSFKIDMKAIASRLWSISPHRRKVEQS